MAVDEGSGDGGDGKVEVQANGGSSITGRARRAVASHDMLLRVIGFCFTLVAAVVAGVDNESQLIPISLSDSSPPLRIPVTAKWHYLSSTVFFVVSNAIACCYAAGSLMFTLMYRNKKNRMKLVLLVCDLIMVALLFSANGAATAVGLIGLNGNSHVQWHSVCHIFKRFCRQGTASITISFLGSFPFLCLVVLATPGLH